MCRTLLVVSRLAATVLALLNPAEFGLRSQSHVQHHPHCDTAHVPMWLLPLPLACSFHYRKELVSNLFPTRLRTVVH